MKKKYFLVISLLILFVIVSVLVNANKMETFDNTIYNSLFGLRSDFLDAFFKGITQLGNTIPVIIILTVLFFFVLKEKEKYLLIIGPLVTLCMNTLMKYVVTRPRPDHIRLIKQGGYSYPSGHAMASIAVYGFLTYYVYKYVKNKYLKLFLIIFLVGIIIGIGLSRIYVGVHYPSDVLAGYILALAIQLIVMDIWSFTLGGIENDKNGGK